MSKCLLQLYVNVYCSNICKVNVYPCAVVVNPLLVNVYFISVVIRKFYSILVNVYFGAV